MLLRRYGRQLYGGKQHQYPLFSATQRIYLYSNKSVEKDLMPRLVQSDFTDEIKEMLLYVCSVHEELLKSSFDEILKRYSSFDEYFEKEYAIDKEVKENLIKKYCHEK